MDGLSDSQELETVTWEDVKGIKIYAEWGGQIYIFNKLCEKS